MVMHVNSYMALHYEYGIRNKENYLSSPPWVTNRIICINTTSIYCHTKLDFKLHIFLTKALTLYAFLVLFRKRQLFRQLFKFHMLKPLLISDKIGLFLVFIFRITFLVARPLFKMQEDVQCFLWYIR